MDTKQRERNSNLFLYQTIQTQTTSGNGDAKPVGAQAGLGTRVAATTSLYTQGAPTETDNPTDFAIQGDGFFAVREAIIRYTIQEMVHLHGAYLQTAIQYLLIRQEILCLIQMEMR